MRAAGWTVTRKERQVQIDLTRAETIASSDTEAVTAALEEHLVAEKVTSIRFGGPVLMKEKMPSGLVAMIQQLADFAKERGILFQVGPM